MYIDIYMYIIHGVQGKTKTNSFTNIASCVLIHDVERARERENKKRDKVRMRKHGKKCRVKCLEE